MLIIQDLDAKSELEKCRHGDCSKLGVIGYTKIL